MIKSFFRPFQKSPGSRHSCRIVPNQVSCHLCRTTINNPRIKIRRLEPSAEPSPLSDTASASFKLLQQTIRQVFPDVVVAPNLTIGGTDSKHYASLSKEVYRFLPLWFKGKENDTYRIHGTNERIAVESYANIVRFYVQLIRNTNE